MPPFPGHDVDTNTILFGMGSSQVASCNITSVSPGSILLSAANISQGGCKKVLVRLYLYVGFLVGCLHPWSIGLDIEGDDAGTG